jgi:hypothetical protein
VSLFHEASPDIGEMLGAAAVFRPNPRPSCGIHENGET